MYAGVADIVLCLIVGDPDTIDMGGYDALHEAQRHGRIAGVWRTDAIAEGEAFTQLMPETHAPVEGTISSIMNNPTAQHLVSKGVLPEITREARLEYFAPASKKGTAQTPAVNMATLERTATVFSREATTMFYKDNDPAMLTSLITVSADLIEHAPIDDLMPETIPTPDTDFNATQLTTLMTCLATTRGRDALAPVLLDNSYRASHLLLAVATYTRGQIRANALCLWALIAVNEKLSSVAQLALEAANNEVPGHNLACLLTQLLERGLHTQLVETFVEGANATLDELGMTPVSYTHLTLPTNREV